jgi:hypothetical protein
MPVSLDEWSGEMPEKFAPVNLPESFLRAAEEATRDPLTFLRRNGSVAVVPFIGGGAPEDDEPSGSPDPGGEEDGTADSGDNSTGDGSDDSGDEDGDDDGDLPDSVKAILRKNRKERRDAENRAAAAEKAAKEAAAKVKEYDDRDKSELDKAKERLDELEKENATLRDTNQTMALRNAFLSQNSVAWHDSDDAFGMAMASYGLRDLEIGDDGKVDKKKLAAIIKSMSSEKSYLVKSEDTGSTKPKQPSGGSFNGGSGKPKDTDKEALARKYPAIAGRNRVTR